MLVQGLDNLTAEEQEEVHRVCDIIPDVDVAVEIFVEDEGEIAENDLVTIKVCFSSCFFLCVQPKLLDVCGNFVFLGNSAEARIRVDSSRGVLCCIPLTLCVRRMFDDLFLHVSFCC